MGTYTLRGIQSMLGISKAVIGGLVASGFVSPSRGNRNEYRFTFQDVVLLRTAYGLQRANIPPRKIVQSLRRLRETLPTEVPLSGLRITAVGSEIAVQEGDAQRHVDSGQLLLDFNVQASQGDLKILGSERVRPPSSEPARPLMSDPAEAAEAAEAAEVTEAGAEAWFERGSVLEGQSKGEAEAAYRRAIGLAPDYVDPYLNLGVILCDGGRCGEAVELYRRALLRCPEEALLHFNLAVALEDLGRRDEALASYETCLRLEPKLADAHYNAARLHELCGHRSQAIRHYSEYRRLQR